MLVFCKNSLYKSVNNSKRMQQWFQNFTIKNTFFSKIRLDCTLFGYFMDTYC